MKPNAHLPARSHGVAVAGPCFYVWDEDRSYATEWARELQRALQGSPLHPAFFRRPIPRRIGAHREITPTPTPTSRAP